MRVATLLFLSLFCCISIHSFATTIRPYKNLGALAKACDAVVEGRVVRVYEFEENGSVRFRYSLRIIKKVKGNLQAGQRIEIQNFHLRIGDLERTVWGDLELEVDHAYLLFLNQLQENVWQGAMLSYAAFEVGQLSGTTVYKPLGLGNEVHLNAQQQQVAPLEIFGAETLLGMLGAVVKEGAQWDETQLTTYARKPFDHNHAQRMAPSHCTFLSSQPWARWEDMAARTLPVRRHSAGDSGCGSVASYVSSAISTMNNVYPGVNLTNAGTHNFNPSCSGGEGATDDEFTTYISSQLGGNRHLLIQFDDPCNEISNLSGCNGTYAIGGLYWFSSQHSFNGMNWRNAAYGYVIINNGAGACSCSGNEYVQLLTHEMSHSLNIGHIAGSGTANMNPSGLGAITALDQECLAFSYADGALPVEVTDFSGWAESNSIALHWATSSEFENDFFTIEKKMSDGTFEVIGNIGGAGTSSYEQFYDFPDLEPLIGDNHYRLLQTDFDGSVQIIQSIVVSYYKSLDVEILPNPITGQKLQAQVINDHIAPMTYRILDLTGQPLFEQQSQSIKGVETVELAMPNLTAGIYFLKVIQGEQAHTVTFVKV